MSQATLALPNGDRATVTWTEQDPRIASSRCQLTTRRVTRVAFGFKRFAHYRIRALLYAGRPNWTLLDNITPP